MDYFSLNYLLLIPLAVLLDFLLGDPHSWPHPVNMLGRLLAGLGKCLLSVQTLQKTAGILCLAMAMCITAFAVFAPLNFFGNYVGIIMAVYLAYTSLALGCLLREGRKACALINKINVDNADTKELEAARKAVSMLVSRDVSRLKKSDLYRTLAETLSENFNDGFVAPLFWLLLTGQIGVWVYKCVSTADSRWGYKYAPWTKRGWAAARLDDALAFIPARVSAFLLYIASGSGIFWGKRYWPGFRRLRRDAAQMESPNAGWSMAAAAWLHGAGMGGPAVYAGKVKQKPYLGPPITEDTAWNAKKIERLLVHLRRAGVLGAALMWSIPLLVTALVKL